MVSTRHSCRLQSVSAAQACTQEQEHNQQQKEEDAQQQHQQRDGHPEEQQQQKQEEEDVSIPDPAASESAGATAVTTVPAFEALVTPPSPRHLNENQVSEGLPTVMAADEPTTRQTATAPAPTALEATSPTAASTDSTAAPTASTAAAPAPIAAPTASTAAAPAPIAAPTAPIAAAPAPTAAPTAPTAAPTAPTAAATAPIAAATAPTATLVLSSPPADELSSEGLDGFRDMPVLRAALQTLLTRVDDSAVFLRPSPEVAMAAREAAKLLYKQCARVLLGPVGPGSGSRAERRALRSSASTPLANLYTDGSFDPEQIWLQLEIATEATIRRVRRLIRVAEPLGSGGGGGSIGLVTAEAAAGIDRLLGGSDDDDADDVMEKEKDSEVMDEDEDGDEDEKMSGSSEEDEEEERRPARKKARRADGSAPSRGNEQQLGRFEDRFFRLSDMERYVEDAERKAMAGDEDLLRDGGEDEEEDEDLFGGGMDDDEEEAGMEALLKNAAAVAGKKKGKDGSGKDAAEMRYKDFFGGGGGEDEDENENEDEDDSSEQEEEDERPQQSMKLSSEEEDDMEKDEGRGVAARRKSGRDAGPRDDGVEARTKGRDKEKDRAAAKQPQLISTHERKLARMQERIEELEAVAMADKSWHLIGEATGTTRPLNSALELDLDFETTAKAVPVQTDDMTNDLEAMIKKRITDHRFDDVIRIVPPPLETKKKEIELDDSKSKAGLGELYEQDYVRQVTGGTVEDKDEKLRQDARTLFKALCGKLDALCRFHFAPKPVVEDMTIRSEVPAIAMEEAAPVAVSKAAMQLPGEVYTPANKDGRPLAEGELTREARKQRRARKKRQHKSREAARDSERKAKAVAAGGSAEVVGRKSESKVVAGKGVKVVQGAGSARHGRTDVGNSSAVFAKLAAEQQVVAAGGGGGKVARELKKQEGGVGKQGGGKKGAVALKL